eukprot:GHVP01049549.1.p1 GENE.GHVP01049549.1~~GHVP01049549.1.p1  ORF type:complete len:293 (-),score=49.72 GHVP01049549.1:131-1009(-)
MNQNEAKKCIKVDERRALTESDIRERLRWRDTLLNRTLLVLERHHIVSREQRLDKGSKTPVYFRINPYILYACSWRHDMILRKMESEEREAQDLEAFECPTCSKRISAIDAACGPQRLEDDHPLCSNCGVPLTLSKSREWQAGIADRKKRVLVQLQELRSSIERLTDMEIEVFGVFSRADKNENKRQMVKKSQEQSSSAPSSSSPVGSGTQSSTSSPPLEISAPSVSSLSFSSVSASSVGGVGSRINFGAGDTNKNAQPKKAVVPWFQQKVDPTGILNYGEPKRQTKKPRPT